MKVDDVLSAAEQIELYRKIQDFKTIGPRIPSAVTITLQGQSKSTSRTFKTSTMIEATEKMLDEVQEEIYGNLMSKGIDVDGE